MVEGAVAGAVVEFPGTVSARLAATGVVLGKPVLKRLPVHDVVYALTGGRVGKCPLARYRLPEPLRGAIVVAPAATNEDGLAVLPELARLLDRMAPWLSCHVVPRLLKRCCDEGDFGRADGTYDVEGVAYTNPGGIAPYAVDMVLLESCGPIGMTRLLCHEAMHKMMSLMSEEAIACLAAAVDGPAWPGAYYSDVNERICRAYESYCWHRIEVESFDTPIPVFVESETSMDTIFRWAFDGTLAGLWIGNGTVDAAAAVKAARAIVLPPPPAPPPSPIETVVCRALARGIGRAWWWAAGLLAPAPTLSPR